MSTTYLLSTIVCREFEEEVGKGQHEKLQAMHIGFSLDTKNNDQYHTAHVYMFAPMNYVYVVVQKERIDEKGKQHIEPMEFLSYHDSCWREAFRTWLHKHAEQINTFRAFKLFDWYDTITLTPEEVEYLRLIKMVRYGYGEMPQGTVNPFNKRYEK